MSKDNFTVFDGGRSRAVSARALPQYAENKRHNQWDARRIMGAVYGYKDPVLILRDEQLDAIDLVRVIRDNSRPIDVEPLAIDRRLTDRRAA